jgi:hypothetical protein
MAPGDVGNASTYGFPARLKVVPGLIDTPSPPGAWEGGKPPREVELPVAAARELEAEGYLRTAGIGPDHRVAIAGLEESSEFNATHMGGTRIEMDVGKRGDEIVAIAASFARPRRRARIDAWRRSHRKRDALRFREAQPRR